MFSVLSLNEEAVYHVGDAWVFARHPLNGSVLYRLQTSAQPSSEDAQEKLVCVTVSADGNIVAAGGNRGKIHFWDLRLRGTATEFNETSSFAIGPSYGLIRGVALSPDCQYLATANGNGTAYLFKLPKYAR